MGLKLKKLELDFEIADSITVATLKAYRKSLKKHLKPGGYLYINVPACNAPHSEPFHYFTGYTPMGLAATVYQAGLQIKEIGQWGNVEYLLKLWTRNPGWSEYRQLQNPGLNEFHNPVITWGLFQL